jgi:TonB family protein
MNTYLAALAFALSAAPSSAQQPSPAARTQAQPAGKWSVEYADWQCILHREYAIEGKRANLSLGLEPLTKVAWMKLAVEGKIGRRDSGQAVMFADGERRPGTLHYDIFGADRFVMREFRLDLDRHRLGDIEGRIRFWTGEHGDFELQLGEFRPAWAALQKCMGELQAEIGIAPADIAQMATAPEGDIFSFVAYKFGVEGEIAILYWVEASGRVGDCRLLKPSGSAVLDKRLCPALKAQAHFKPARNAKGEPIRVRQFRHLRIRKSPM